MMQIIGLIRTMVKFRLRNFAYSIDHLGFLMDPKGKGRQDIEKSDKKG